MANRQYTACCHHFHQQEKPMGIQLNFINKSNDTNNSEVVIFQ